MQYDFSQLTDATDLRSIPAGVYPVRVREVREGKARDGSARWSLRLEVAEGELAGRHAAWDSPDLERAGCTACAPSSRPWASRWTAPCRGADRARGPVCDGRAGRGDLGGSAARHPARSADGSLPRLVGARGGPGLDRACCGCDGRGRGLGALLRMRARSGSAARAEAANGPLGRDREAGQGEGAAVRGRDLEAENLRQRTCAVTPSRDSGRGLRGDLLWPLIRRGPLWMLTPMSSPILRRSASSRRPGRPRAGARALLRVRGGGGAPRRRGRDPRGLQRGERELRAHHLRRAHGPRPRGLPGGSRVRGPAIAFGSEPVVPPVWSPSPVPGGVRTGPTRGLGGAP